VSSFNWIDEEASEGVAELLDRLRPKLERILLHFRIPAQDAEDLIQDVLLSLVSRRPRLESPEAWLLAGLRYRCLMYWRSKRRSLYRTVDATLLEGLAEPAAPESERADLARDLDRCLTSIPTRCRSVLKLRYALGLRPPEVARELGYNSNSIATITRRCLAALCQKLVGVGY
jgi:RNA polymerase sigma factor (sigma-70 family)